MIVGVPLKNFKKITMFDYYTRGKLAYTEDHVLVKNLFFVCKTVVFQCELQSFFEKFGLVERLHLYPTINSRVTGYVVFANPCDAAKALNCARHLFDLKIRPNYSSRQWEYSMKGELAYTEDHVLVKSLFLMNIEEELKPQQLQNYFEKEYGCVESLHLFPRKEGTRSVGIASGNRKLGRIVPLENRTRAGYVVFSNPCDAAKALLKEFHYVGLCRITVRASYSWHQPDADKMPHRPEKVDPNEPPAAIMKLNDHCLEHIFSQLSLPDRIHFARTCFRFCNIYKGMSPYLDKSINFKSFEAMTAWDLHDFFKLSGRNIKNIEGTPQLYHCKHVCSFLGRHCINLQSMAMSNNDFKKLNIFKMFARLNSLQKLDLHGCDLTDEDLKALKHLRQLKKLDLSENRMMRGRCMNCLPNSIESLNLSKCNLHSIIYTKMFCGLPLLKKLNLPKGIFNVNGCKSLEVLSIHYENDGLAEYKHIARLPSLKKLTLNVSFASRKNLTLNVSFASRKISPMLITWLVEYKSKQLEQFEILSTLSDCINDEILLEIGKLTALHTLVLENCSLFTDRGLGALFNLQELREINIKSNSKITDKGVLRLILDCPKLQVLNLVKCVQLTDKLLHDIILKLQNNKCHRPLPIKLDMTGTRVNQFTLLNADVAAKNIIDVRYDACMKVKY